MKTAKEIQEAIEVLGLEWSEFERFMVGKTYTQNNGENIYYESDLGLFLIKSLNRIVEGVKTYKELKRNPSKIQVECETIYVEFQMSSKADHSEMERYHAFMIMFCKYLWKERMGVWGGRETLLKPQNNSEYHPTTTYCEIDNEKVSIIKEKIKEQAMGFNIYNLLDIRFSTTPAKSTLHFSKEFIWHF